MSMNTYSLSENELISLPCSASAAEAINKMRSEKIRHLPIVENNELQGIISDRDILRSLRFNPFSTDSIPKIAKELRVDSIMTWPVRTVDADTPVLNLIQIMIDEKISAVVLDGRKKEGAARWGILTTEDMLRLLKSELLENSEAENDSIGNRLQMKLLESPIGPLLQGLSNSGI